MIYDHEYLGEIYYIWERRYEFIILDEFGDIVVREPFDDDLKEAINHHSGWFEQLIDEVEYLNDSCCMCGRSNCNCFWDYIV